MFKYAKPAVSGDISILGPNYSKICLAESGENAQRVRMNRLMGTSRARVAWVITAEKTL
jgi:hypothetical protein